jgi:hypothetical protein
LRLRAAFDMARLAAAWPAQNLPSVAAREHHTQPPAAICRFRRSRLERAFASRHLSHRQRAFT